MANPSGDNTEYTLFSIIITLFVTANARAPPLPPSPVNIAIEGTFKVLIQEMQDAIASP